VLKFPALFSASSERCRSAGFRGRGGGGEREGPKKEKKKRKGREKCSEW